MATGDEGRGSSRKPGGVTADDAVSAPTIEGAAIGSANPTPVPAKEHGPISNADTAVATKSQTMAAQTGPELEAEAEDGLVGTTLLGRYEVTKRIGKGGMGAVYEATHKLIGKRVAVKVLLDKYATKDPIVARLEQEARLASSIGHEHIIDITDFGQTADGRTFVVMEYLEGEALGTLIAREGQIEEQRVIRIARQCASALGAAHAKGVIHRDIKPDNIFLLRRRETDFVKVVDFGISKAVRPDEDDGGASPRLTQTGMVLGTPLYMSPEQARGDEELDHRIDIYALGVIMYEMVTGEVPFRGTNYLSILSQVLNDEPRAPRDIRPELTIELESVIMKALAKDPDERYQSMDDLAEDLAVLATTEGTTTARARISAQRYRPKKARKGGLRILAWVAGVAVVVAAVAVTVSVTMGGGSDKKDEPAVAAAPIDAGVSEAVVPPDAAPEKKVEIVEIPIETSPPGAKIYQGDRLIGTSPMVFRWEKVNESISLYAELEGHHDGTTKINPYLEADRELPVSIRLKPVKKGTKRIKIKRPEAKVPPKPPTPVKKGDDTAAGELTGNPYD